MDGLNHWYPTVEYNGNFAFLYNEDYSKVHIIEYDNKSHGLCGRDLTGIIRPIKQDSQHIDKICERCLEALEKRKIG